MRIYRVLSPIASVILLATVAACAGGGEDSSGGDSGAYWQTNCGSDAAPVGVTSASGQAISNSVTVLDDPVPVVFVVEEAPPAQNLVTEELRSGDGATVQIDDLITVDYCGVSMSSGALFDSSWLRGEPATFPLSQGALIQGWVDGIPGMQVGERRVLIIPGDLAYGSNPPPGIEPNETLIFVVELRQIVS